MWFGAKENFDIWIMGALEDKMVNVNWNPTKAVCFFKTLLDLTDVCPLLTKQYMQVGLQIQYIYTILKMVFLCIHGMVKSFGQPLMLISLTIN